MSSRKNNAFSDAAMAAQQVAARVAKFAHNLDQALNLVASPERRAVNGNNPSELHTSAVP